MVPRELSGNKLTPIERLKMRIEMLEDRSREHHREIRCLKEDWAEFAPTVADHISHKILIPAIVRGLMGAIEVSPALEVKRKDTLDIPRRKQREAG